jgi:hypothetical protein
MKTIKTCHKLLLYICFILLRQLLKKQKRIEELKAGEKRLELITAASNLVLKKTDLCWINKNKKNKVIRY